MLAELHVNFRSRSGCDSDYVNTINIPFQPMETHLLEIEIGGEIFAGVVEKIYWKLNTHVLQVFCTFEFEQSELDEDLLLDLMEREGWSEEE